MKAWIKVLLGIGAGAAIGVGAACLGKKHNDDDDYATVDDETEDYDSESNEEAE